MACVGIFFAVDDRLLCDAVELGRAEKYGDFLIYPASHFDVWEAKYKDVYRASYDRYPRGRVAYNAEKDFFSVLADRCISPEVLAEVLRRFGIEPGKARIDTSDSHYVCANCSKAYFPD